jgi:hypothetical protein
MATDNGRVFRDAWIDGVNQHFPDVPKPGYIAPWDETPEWEQECASAVFDQVHALIAASGGATSRLSREQKSRFVAICWITQIYKHISDPKPGYVADWADLPDWQRETDADIFERIEVSADARSELAG